MTYKGETRILETSVPSQGLRETFKALKGGGGQKVLEGSSGMSATRSSELR